MSRYAGIDYSTWEVDVVFIDEDHVDQAEWLRFRLEGGDAFDRARSIGRNHGLFSSGIWEDVIAVGIEDPFGGGRNSRQVVPKLKMVQGAIVSRLPARLLVHPLSANQWRSTVGLAGNCSKRQVEIWAQLELGHRARADQQWADIAWQQDGYDAYALARAVRTLVTQAAAA